MKKIIIVFMLSLVFIFFAYSQEKPFEGYNGYIWGAAVETVKKDFPAAIVLPNEAYEGSSKETCLYLEDPPVGRAYLFFDNKLYSGKTVYTNPNNNTVDAIINKLVGSYGPAHSISQDNKRIYWKITPLLVVILELDFGKSNRYIRIIYSNPVLEAQCENYALQEKTNNLKM